MFLVTRGLSKSIKSCFIPSVANSFRNAVTIHTSIVNKCENVAEAEENTKGESLPVDSKRLSNDRTKVIPIETSMRYMKSSAYKETYGEQLVWEQYRRNHKGLFPPKKTRKTCIRKGTISTGNPCPICRDEYLVVDYRNINLLNQFISPQTGEVLSYSKTGLCQRSHFQLLVAVKQARDHGFITFNVPFRKYDYSHFYGNL